MMNRLLVLVVIIILSCKDDEQNPHVNKVVGTYEGFINYFGTTPIPGDAMVEEVEFNITRHGENKIKMSTSFDLVLPVTRVFTTEVSGSEIISLGAGQDIHYTSNGIEITTGGTDFQGWGEMCGYYNVTVNDLRISFEWSNGTDTGAGILFATKIN